MIGISIYADSVRAVRIQKQGKTLNLKDTHIEPLYENTIVQGKIVDVDSFSEVIIKVKEALMITDTEEVYLSIPNGDIDLSKKIIQGDVRDLSRVAEQIPKKINNKVNETHFLRVSGSYKVSLADKFEDAFEAEARRMEQKLEGKEEVVSFVTQKTVSYVSILQEEIDKYLKIFNSCRMNVVSIEPMAVTALRYLKNEVNEPFMIIDIGFDYTSLIMYSEKNGAMLFNVPNVGTATFEEYENEDSIEPIINNHKVMELSQKILFAKNLYKSRAIDENGSDIETIVFLNNDCDYVVEKIEADNLDAEVLSAQEVLPIGVSTKKYKGNYNEIYLYHIAIEAVKTGNSKISDVNPTLGPLELNILPQKAKENVVYNKVKDYVTKGSKVLCGVALIAFVGTAVVNFSSLYRIKDNGQVSPELKAQYEDTKKQNDKMKTNIEKLNTIAKNKHELSGIVDEIITAKNENVYITSMNLSYLGRKIIVECMTSDTTAPDMYLQSLKAFNNFKDAQILSRQSKDGKTAFQIAVSLKKADVDKDTKKKKKK